MDEQLLLSLLANVVIYIGKKIPISRFSVENYQKNRGITLYLIGFSNRQQLCRLSFVEYDFLN